MGAVILAEGTGDLGRTFAREFLHAGYSVAVFAPSYVKGNRVAGSLRAIEELPVVPFKCDTRSLADVANSFKEAKARFGSIDALVNMREVPFDESKDGYLQRFAAAEPFITSVYACSFIAGFEIPAGGSIITVAPIQSRNQDAELNAHVLRMNHEISEKLPSHRVNCILPGYSKPCCEDRIDYIPDAAEIAVRMVKDKDGRSGCIGITDDRKECYALAKYILGK
jgi:NAD(P)-dependent dehydrogenase (short-subunit alcohol dehydrogenase family)